MLLALAPAGLAHEAIQAGRIAFRRAGSVLGAVPPDLPVINAGDAALPQVQDEAAVRLTRERHAEDQAVHLELEARRLDRLLQLLQEIVIGPAQLVCLEDPLAGREGEVAVLRLHLALEDGRKLELGRGSVAEQGMGQHRLRVGVEGTAHGGRLLLRQSRCGVVGQVADVELVLVLVPKGHRRVAERSRGTHGQVTLGLFVGWRRRSGGAGLGGSGLGPAVGAGGGDGLGGSGLGGNGFGG